MSTLTPIMSFFAKFPSTLFPIGLNKTNV